MKNYNIHCDVHYYSTQFEIKIQFVYGETKRTNCIMWYNGLNGIVQGVNWIKL